MQKFTAKQYLQIDIASNFGLDRANWDVRLDWFNQNERQLEELVPNAKEPALYYAGILAWKDYCAGTPSGYPVSFDATSSGLQILACLTGDRKAAELCNVVSTGNREDAYTGVYNRMITKLGDTSKISREKAKDAVMTALYGSKAVPKEVFGEGILLNTFYETMLEVAPAAWELNEAFLNLWNPNAYSHDWVLPDNFHVITKVMSQVKETVHFLNKPYEVFHNVNAPTEEGRSLGANTTHSIDGMVVREMVRRCNYNPKDVARMHNISFLIEHGSYIMQDHGDNDSKLVAKLWDHYKKSGYLSARILSVLHPFNHSLVDMPTVMELVATLPKKPFQLMTIHDCFRCLPNYVNDLREQYNLQLALIAKSNLLSYLLTQLVGRPVTVGKMDPNLYKDILKTEYALS